MTESTKTDVAELRKKYEAAKKMNPVARDDYTPGEKTFSGVLKPEAYRNRRAAHDLLQNMREQDLEAAEKKAKGGYVKAADGCAQRGKTRGTYL